MAQRPLQVGERWFCTPCPAPVGSREKSSALLFARLLKRKCCVQLWWNCTHSSIHSLFTVSDSMLPVFVTTKHLGRFSAPVQLKTKPDWSFSRWICENPDLERKKNKKTNRGKKKTLGDTAASPGDSTACLNYPHVSTTRKGLFKELPGKPQQPECFYKYSHGETRRNSRGPVTPTRQHWSLCHVWPACWWGAAAVADGTAGVSHRPWSTGGKEKERGPPECSEARLRHVFTALANMFVLGKSAGGLGWDVALTSWLKQCFWTVMWASSLSP